MKNPSYWGEEGSLNSEKAHQTNVHLLGKGSVKKVPFVGIKMLKARGEARGGKCRTGSLTLVFASSSNGGRGSGKAEAQKLGTLTFVTEGGLPASGRLGYIFWLTGVTGRGGGGIEKNWVVQGNQHLIALIK